MVHLRGRKEVEMNWFIGVAAALIIFGAIPAAAESTVISSNGSRPSVKGAAANFTGDVIVEPLYGANEHTSSTGGDVNFSPGARAARPNPPPRPILIVPTRTGRRHEERG